MLDIKSEIWWRSFILLGQGAKRFNVRLFLIMVLREISVKIVFSTSQVTAIYNIFRNILLNILMDFKLYVFLLFLIVFASFLNLYQSLPSFYCQPFCILSFWIRESITGPLTCTLFTEGSSLSKKVLAFSKEILVF